MTTPRHWQSSEARDKLYEVVRRAKTEGPQIVTRYGKECVVFLSIDEYRRLTTEHATDRGTTF